MSKKFEFTQSELDETREIMSHLKETIGDTLKSDDEDKLKQHLKKAVYDNQMQRDVFGLNPILHALKTAQIAVDEIGLKRDGVLATLLYTLVVNNYSTIEEMQDKFGESVAHVIRGLVRIQAYLQRMRLV